MALISDDVDWPHDDAGRLHGTDEVRAVRLASPHVARKMPAAIFVSPLEYAAGEGRISLNHNFRKSVRIPSTQLAAE